MTCGYNGWKNYETWVVSLWLDNDPGTSDYWRETAREILADAEPTAHLTRNENARIALAERIKDELEDGVPCPDAGLYADLLHAAMGEVEWNEIAEDESGDQNWTGAEGKAPVVLPRALWRAKLPIYKPFP